MSRSKDLFYETIDELILNHPYNGEVETNTSECELTFTKKVADDDKTMVYINFDINGKPIDGFLAGEMADDEEWDFNIYTELQESLRLTARERIRAILNML